MSEQPDRTETTEGPYVRANRESVEAFERDNTKLTTAKQPTHTVCVGRHTLKALARREAVCLPMSDGSVVCLIDADDYPREAINAA